MNVEKVESLDDPRVSVYANMRDAELAQRRDPLDAAAHGGVFIAEGELVVRRLIASRFEVQSVLTTETRLEAVRDALERLPSGTPVYVVEQRVMDSIVGFSMHRGLLAVGVRGAGMSAGEVIDRGGVLVVLEDVNNHDNLGGIFRNVAALGGERAGVILSPRCVDPLYRKALRVSIGCVLSVAWARCGEEGKAERGERRGTQGGAAEEWPGVIDVLNAQGVETLAMTPREGAEGLARVAREVEGKRVAIVLGAEGPGLSEGVMQKCSRRVRIEMDKSAEEVDSLNVHVAAGIALHQLWAVGRGRG